jgi:phosphate-selective porin OprO/OprP
LPPPTVTTREAELEARIKQLEATVQQLANQMQSVQAASTADNPGTRVDPNASIPHDRRTSAAPASGGPLSPGQGGPPNPAASARFQMPATVKPVSTAGRFGPGFEWKTDDDEFVLQFHNLTQIDGRFYNQPGQDPVTDTFAIPREWFMFSGRLTKPYEYFVSLQSGFDVVGVLDVFLNIHYDDRLQFRVGRGKTPFTYEFYQEPIQGLLVPERSLFFNNFALNRAIGLQTWGQLFDKRLDYAFGIYNTNRNGVVDTSDGKNFLGYLNYRPFAKATDSILENFSFGGSVDTGNQVGPPVPSVFRTIVPTAGNAAVGTPFLSFNQGIQEAGNHTMWDVHAALFYKQWTVISEWGSGRQPYGNAANFNQKVQLPVSSWYIQTGYMLTGETVSFRGVPNPYHNFDLRPGKFGLGAWEIFGRYDTLQLGEEVFRYNLANQADWARSLYLTDMGFNWYWNRWIKFVFDWEHAVFDKPVLYAPDKKHLTSDLFWMRFQIYF